MKGTVSRAEVRRDQSGRVEKREAVMLFGLPTDVVIIAGSLVLGLLMLMIVIARMYRKVGPNEALIRYGMGGTHVYCGRGAIIFPMVQTCRDLSLELMSFDVAPQQNLYTKQGVAVTVEAVAQIKVKSDKESILTAAEQFLSKEPTQREGLIRLVMEGHLRGIIGQLTVEQIVKEPEMVGDRMRSTCAADMSKMGLEVVSFTIKEVRDKSEYITNMGRPGRCAHQARRGSGHCGSRARHRHQTGGGHASRGRRQSAGRSGARGRGNRLACQASRSPARPGHQEGQLPGDDEESASHRGQGVRNRNQRHATTGCRGSR